MTEGEKQRGETEGQRSEVRSQRTPPLPGPLLRLGGREGDGPRRGEGSEVRRRMEGLGS